MTAEENIMNNVQLLPLPEYLRADYKRMATDSHEAECKHYARANVARATAAQDAEIDALRAEVETLRDGLDYLRQMQGVPDVLELRAKAASAERLAEALREKLRLWRIREDGDEPRTDFDAGYEQASDECANAIEALLREQEDGRG